MMQLRDYQQAAIDSVLKHFQDGYKGNPLIVAPTGTGKSLIFAGMIYQFLAATPTMKILGLTHSKELIEQNYDKLVKIWPNAPVGIYSASVGSKKSNQPITIGGIQSIYKKAHLFGKIDLIIVDEAHMINSKDNSMYMKFFKDVHTVNPKCVIVGMTATDYRLQVGHIWGQENSIFERKCIDLASMDCFNWFIDEGYLVPVVPKKTKLELNINGVHLRGGEFVESELYKAVNKDSVTKSIISDLIENYTHLDKWLLFCSGVDHAIRVSELLNLRGIKSEALHSNLSKSERENILAKFEMGEIQAITNNNILTTGFDCPSLKLIVMLRPTMSSVLWVQMLGRGTRPSYADGFDLSTKEGRIEAIRQSDKQYCLVLDYSGNSRRLGQINDPKIPRKKGKGNGEMPSKICPQCDTYNHAKAVICSFCGKEFEFNNKLTLKASEKQLIAKKELPQIENFEVRRITYSKNKGKNGKKDTLRVSYYCFDDFNKPHYFNDFVCIEHPDGTYPKRKAFDWWRFRSNNPFPEKIDDVLDNINFLKSPTHLKVHVNATKNFPQILSYCFDGTCFNTKNASNIEIETETALDLQTSLLKQAENKNKKPDFDDDIPF